MVDTHNEETLETDDMASPVFGLDEETFQTLIDYIDEWEDDHQDLLNALGAIEPAHDAWYEWPSP